MINQTECSKLLLTSLWTYLQRTNCGYALRLRDVLHTIAPRVHTEFGKKAFSFTALSARNVHQNDLKLSELIRFDSFILNDCQTLDSVCVFKLLSTR